jgi:hypothetical protein
MVARRYRGDPDSDSEEDDKPKEWTHISALRKKRMKEEILPLEYYAFPPAFVNVPEV